MFNEIIVEANVETAKPEGKNGQWCHSCHSCHHCHSCHSCHHCHSCWRR